METATQQQIFAQALATALQRIRRMLPRFADPGAARGVPPAVAGSALSLCRLPHLSIGRCAPQRRCVTCEESQSAQLRAVDIMSGGDLILVLYAIGMLLTAVVVCLSVLEQRRLDRRWSDRFRN